MSDLGDGRALAQESFKAMLSHLEKRVSSLELTIATMETERAVGEEKWKHLLEKFGHVDTRLDKIDGHIGRLVWLIIAAILGAFMSFVLQGSLTNV